MKHWLIGIVSLIGVIGCGALMMTYAFTQDMDSDETREAEIQKKQRLT